MKYSQFILFLLINFFLLKQGVCSQKASSPEITLNQLIQETLALMPPSTQKLAAQIPIHLKKTTQINSKVDEIGLHDSKNNVIFINEKYVTLLMQKGDNHPVNTRHKSVKNTLIATLIHEIAHHLDQKNILHVKNSDLHFFCNDKSESYDICRFSEATSFSNDYNFLNLANYNFTKSILSRPLMVNKDDSRRIDLQEKMNPRESFAIHMEYYILDPEFKCRKPLLFEYYKETFNFDPFPMQTCTDFDKTFFLRFDTDTSKIITPELTRPKGLLYQIHYLIASPGKQLISRFGHSMLRLVYCNPKRTTLSDECMKDHNYHIIVSPTSLKINPNDPISYTHFLAQTFDNLLLNYNKLENRDIYSIPLKLNIKEIEILENVLLEQHWSYKSPYEFIENNCTLDVLNSLKKALPKNLSIQTLRSNLPFNLYYDLRNIGLIERKKLADWEIDSTPYYYYPQASKNIEKVEQLITRGLQLNKSYGNLSTEQRIHLIQSKILSNKTKNQNLIVAIRFVEKDKQLRWLLKLAEKIEHQESSTKIAGAQIMNARPWRTAIEFAGPRGYGIPSNLELKSERMRVESLLKKIGYQQTDNMTFDYANLAIRYHEAHEILKIEEILKLLEN